MSQIYQVSTISIWEITRGPRSPLFSPCFTPDWRKTLKNRQKMTGFWLNFGRMAKNEKKVQIMKVAHYGYASFTEKINRKYTVNQPEMNRK